MLIPIYIKQPGVELPSLGAEESRYVLATNGTFLEQRRSSMFTTSVRVDPLDRPLASHHEYCRLTCGKLPRVMHRAMLAFFKYAHEVHGGEAALVLLYHPEQQTFRWHCPEQFVDIFETWSGWATWDTIEFKNPLVLPEGYLHFGDAHLHAGGPSPSAIDINDDQDGLHIIVGTIRSVPSYHLDFVMGQTRFAVAPETFFADPQCRPFDRPPARWLKQIRLRKVWRPSEA